MPKWRPEEFKNTASAGDDPIVAFEVAFDAAVEALRKNGWRLDSISVELQVSRGIKLLYIMPKTGDGKHLLLSIGEGTGTLVFIPDDPTEQTERLSSGGTK